MMLREISLLWSMIHTLVLFFLLFEPRYTKKKTRLISYATMIPLIIINSILALFINADTMGMALLVTLSIPNLIVFWILAKNRDGRFFFTFCLVDTMVLEIIYNTNSQLLHHPKQLYLYVCRTPDCLPNAGVVCL